MLTRYFALGIGIAYLLVGLLGFIPGTHPMTADMPDIAVDALYGRLLGIFPVNILHNIVHLLFGVWGLLAYKSLSASKGFAKGVAIIYAVLVVAGLIPGLNTMFGLVPLFGNDVWLHIILAAPAAYFGWMHRDTATTGNRT